MELSALSLADVQAKLRAKEVSPTELLRVLDERIARVDSQIHGYLSRDLDAALACAENADVSLPLGGVPIAIKDVINVSGEPCTAASKILEGYRANYDATVIRKLRAAGAIPFGRCNLDEFAMGSSTENSAFGHTRNPWDTTRIPGGSSGGSGWRRRCGIPISAAARGGSPGGRWRAGRRRWWWGRAPRCSCRSRIWSW